MMFGHTEKHRCWPEAAGGAGYGAGGEAVAADEDLERRGEALLLADTQHTQEVEFSVITG